MFRKILTLILILAFATTCFAQGRVTKKELTFYDIFGNEYTGLTSVTIQDAGTSTTSTLYSERTGSTSLTNPIVSGLGDGRIEFWSRDADYKVVATDGTDTITVDNMTGSNTRLPFWGEYIGSLSSYNLGQSDDLDFTYAGWVIDGDTSTRLDVIPDVDASIFAIGSGTYQSDVYIYESSTDYMFFDEGNGILNMAGINQEFDDSSYLYFGSDSDISIKFDNTNDDLDILGDNSEISIGATDAGLDVIIWGETAGDYAYFDEDNNELYMTDYDIQFDDDADAIFGSDDDFKIESDTAKTLEILPGATTDDYAVNLGVDQSGVDLKIFGATTGEYWLYDASADSVLANTGNYLYTATDAEANQFKVDATGTVAGFAIVLETTNGGVQINADDSSNGDITIDAADVLTLTHVDKIIYDGAATEVWEIEGTANAYETTISFTDPTADQTINVPAGSSGTLLVPYYKAWAASGTIDPTQAYGGIFTNAGASAAIELEMPSAVAGMQITFVTTTPAAVSLDAATGDQIICDLTDTAADKITSGASRCHIITLFAIDATSWIPISISGTWSDGGA